MTSVREPDTAPAGPSTVDDPFCGHEYDDGGLCAADAVAGTGRCPGHQDDGQPAR